MFRDDLKRGKRACREFVATMTDDQLQSLIDDARENKVPFDSYGCCLVGHGVSDSESGAFYPEHHKYRARWKAANQRTDPPASEAYRLLGLIEREPASIRESDKVRNQRILWIALAERRRRAQRIVQQAIETRLQLLAAKLLVDASIETYVSDKN